MESEEGEVGGSGDGVIIMLNRSSLTPKLAYVAGGIYLISGECCCFFRRWSHEKKERKD